MAKGTAAKTVEEISGAVPYLVRLPAGRAWIDYDREADVLYISLKRPQKATDTELLEDQGILLRYQGKELVGLTVLDASKRKKDNKKREGSVHSTPLRFREKERSLP
ncbi:MAG: DUF2283 domain-containing protein [Deltaproteobacteria bacterium]|nr:DUF2283 domain-containing protein [Deltaproteobacteria bacterium]